MPKTLPASMKLAVAAAAALCLATPALADSATLRFDDLDLASPAGKAALERRIEQVLQQVCSAESVTGTRIPNRKAIDACRADAQRQIEAQVARRTSQSGLGG